MPPRRPRIRPLASFLRTEAGGATVLLTATVVALVWANSAAGDAYRALWETELTLGFGPVEVTEDLGHWVNDALMVVFFFVVGLEIKRELALGELRDPRSAALPIIAALGGIAVPAAVYLAFNFGGPGARGWAIPAATDIAFAVGVLAFFSRRVPAGLKVFLLSVAIADDVGAILIIAVAYSEGIDPGWLAAAIGAFLTVAVMRRFVLNPWWYLPVGFVAWFTTLESGVHATIAGVVLGLLTPAGEVGGRRVLEELEHALHPVSAYFVLPVFALANAGVEVGGDLGELAANPVTVGIVAGLVVGKTAGLAGAAWVAVRSGVGRLPLGVGMRHITAVAPLGGIGFTVALFIADLAFADEGLLDAAKIGVLAGSALAGVVGSVALSAFGRARPAGRDRPHAGGGRRPDRRDPRGDVE